MDGAKSGSQWEGVGLSTVGRLASEMSREAVEAEKWGGEADGDILREGYSQYSVNAVGSGSKREGFGSEVGFTEKVCNSPHWG